IRARTLASVGFFPLKSLSFLKSPFKPGPIFFSSLSGLWQIAHCSKTALPFSGSPLALESAASDAAVKTKQKKQMESRSLRKRFSPLGFNSSSYNQLAARCGLPLAGVGWQAKAPAKAPAPQLMPEL